MAVDTQRLRTLLTQRLAEGQKQALRGVQDVFAQRGTTGGGREAQALGETGRQFGLGAGQGEAGLLQFLGGLEQQESQFGRQLGQQESQFGQQLSQQGQQFDQSLEEQIANRIAGQELQRSQLFGQAGPVEAGDQTLGGQQFAAGQAEAQNLNSIAQSMGFPNAEAMALAFQLDPEKAGRLQNVVFSENRLEQNRNAALGARINERFGNINTGFGFPRR